MDPVATSAMLCLLSELRDGSTPRSRDSTNSKAPPESPTLPLTNGCHEEIGKI